MKGIALKADFAASSNIKAKVVSALKYLFVADSLSMPVHWFYRVSDIYSLYPNGITNLEDAMHVSKSGAKAIGFIFYNKSPRCIKIDRATRL